jgi:cytochrome c2
MPATEEYSYSLPGLHRIFAASSVALLLATIWMMAADHDDEWRVYQKKFQTYTADKLRAKEAALKTPAYTARVTELQNEIDDANKAMSQHKADHAKAQSVLNKAQGEFTRYDNETRTRRAERGKAQADYDLAIRDELSAAELARRKKNFDDINLDVTNREIVLQDKKDKLASALATVKEFEKQRDALEVEKKKTQRDFDQNHKALAKIEPDTWLSRMKRDSMEWPILDGFNSHLRIQQDWIPGLTVNLGGMKDVARFDRCRTCHQAADMVEAGNAPAFPAAEYKQPFSTHPRPDVYLTAASPHPVGKFGCTICHDGQGSGTSFQNGSHTPNSPDIAHKWEHEHKWFHNHFWELPMLPQRFTEAGCLKCHHNVVELGVNPKFGPTAPKVVEGYNLVRQFGCFGCHEINGFDGPKGIGPDLRLEPSPEDAAKMAGDPSANPGSMRKVGPALTHIKDKTTAGWAEYWTEDPTRFRPETRMPKFFNLEGQKDDHNQKLTPVEISSLVHFLFEKSTPNKLLTPEKGYVADAARGKVLFSQRGCLACHSHDEFAGIKEDFGPNLTHVHKKIRDDQTGRDWVYTWVRNPQLHSPRSKMPNLFLETYEEAGKTVDPAADIVAFLLSKGPGKYDGLPKSNEGLNELAVLYLSKVLTKEQVDKFMKDGWYPETNLASIKGDEVELFTGKEGEGKKLTESQLTTYVGRRTISRYGCYGCHDIAGFEKARPIGTGLQNWGRKAKNKLALEHIAEYLHHHGEPDGASTHDRVERNMKLASGDGFQDPQVKETEMSHAYFYEQVMHGERAGFLWQKLRAPRSYDFRKIETKGFDERLRMPKFPFNDKQIEAIATFVLGLVAEPPSEKYIYTPTGPAKARIDGEKLITKYNCTGCHMLELPEIKYGVDTDSLTGYQLGEGDYQPAVDLLLKLKPLKNALTGQTITTADKKSLPVIKFHGTLVADANKEDPPEDREYVYELWDNLKIGEKKLLPGSKMLIPELNRVSVTPSRGGEFAEWLVNSLVTPEMNRSLAWQASPPPLYLEGIKVQTPWLYEFLKNPTKIRYTTVLRMPQFNMSDSEAMSLANYFAAVDGAVYPYQDVPERQPGYLASMEHKHPNYLPQGWQLFQACVSCHSVAGREYAGKDPKKDIRGPNLMHVQNRLRSEWLQLWLYKPSWITPYTSMPSVFPKNVKNLPELFGGKGLDQTTSVHDALVNYQRLAETQSKLAPVAAPVAAADKPEAEKPDANKPDAAKPAGEKK